jgi:hypothetical protein
MRFPVTDAQPAGEQPVALHHLCRRVVTLSRVQANTGFTRFGQRKIRIRFAPVAAFGLG